MWQHIVALPLAAKIITVLGVAGLGVWGWIKHRAISEMASAATKTAETWLWGWIGKKIYAATPPTPATAKPHNERTYGGTFRLYAKHVNYPKDFFFVLEHEGITHKIPVIGTNMFSGVRTGDFVEVDTLTGANYYAEIVQRVRVMKENPKPRGPFASGPAGY